jgi:hypothetical protein
MRQAKLKSCPVCDGPDNCSIRADGSQVFCRRSAGASWPGSVPGAGGYTCPLDASLPRPAVPAIRKPSPSPSAVASANARHSVYSAFLNRLSISSRHTSDLLARGLSQQAIEACCFRSATPTAEASEIARNVAREHNLVGVPGFFRERGEWRAAWLDESIIIPVWDQRARIVALMRRRTVKDNLGKYVWFSSGEDRDGNPREGGASSGSPCNWSNSHMMKDAREVTLVEGVLKSIVAAHLMGQPTIGNAPSGFGANFAANLKTDLPCLRTVFVAFDMDFQRNDHVRSAMFRLINQLERERFDVRVRTWPPQWKGIDDYLLSVSEGRAAA